METIGIALRQAPAASPGSRLFRILRAQNPFYLLSALCMLAGCWLLAGSVTGAEHAARLARVWTLSGLLNLYELLLVGLGVFLIRRGFERDGRMLLLLEMAFLADATNLHAEGWALGLGTGLAMSSAALALGATKAFIVVRGLGLRPSARALAAFAAAMIALLGAPGLLALMNRTGMTMELPIHGVWWLLSAAALAVFLLLRGQGAGQPALARLLGRALAGALLGSLLVHTVAASWVHAAGFRLSHLAPLMAALAVIALRMEPGRLFGQRGLKALRAGLAGAALLFGAAFPEALAADLPGLDGVTFSPLRGVLLALAAACLWDFLARRGWLRAAAAGLFFLAACAGHSVASDLETWLWLAGKVLPRTAGQWGAAALAAAFVLLAVGAARSLGRGKVPGGRER